MVYNRFVEIGRVAYVAFGPDEGKLVAIVDVVDQNKALVDGPASGVGRKVMSFKQLHLTKFVINISHSARSGTVRKAWEKAEVDKKWQESTWAKKIASKQRKSQLTDYERFKLMKAKQMRNRIINTQFGKLRKAAKVAAKKPIKKKHVNKKRHTAPVKK